MPVSGQLPPPSFQQLHSQRAAGRANSAADPRGAIAEALKAHAAAAHAAASAFARELLRLEHGPEYIAVQARMGAAVPHGQADASDNESPMQRVERLLAEDLSVDHAWKVASAETVAFEQLVLAVDPAELDRQVAAVRERIAGMLPPGAHAGPPQR